MLVNIGEFIESYGASHSHILIDITGFVLRQKSQTGNQFGKFETPFEETLPA
jgi:hypothetical protein